MAQELRIRFETSDSTWRIEESLVRRVEDPFGFGDIAARPYQFPSWELKSIHDNFAFAILELVDFAATSKVGVTQIQSIDLGPVDPNSPLVTSIVNSLSTLTL